MKNDKQEQQDKLNKYTVIEMFTAVKPEIFRFFKTIYIKRKAELKTKLENRPTKEEKEGLLADERGKSIYELENHPLFEIYQLLSKPLSANKAFYDSVLTVTPQFT